jgi:DNA-binding NtrC family response regulator
MQEIQKLATLLSNIKTNVLIIGDTGVGKRKIAQTIAPKIPIVETTNASDVVQALKQSEEVIIPHFELIKNIDLIPSNQGRIIATATKRPKQSIVDKYFGMTIEIANLTQRPEDVEALAKKFYDDAIATFALISPPALANAVLDLSSNCHSLRRSITQYLLLNTFDEEAMTKVLENYITLNFPEENAYEKLLPIFDKAIVMAAASYHKSQVMMANHLGINRNTLRKKITELAIRIKDDN